MCFWLLACFPTIKTKETATVVTKHKKKEKIIHIFFMYQQCSFLLLSLKNKGFLQGSFTIKFYFSLSPLNGSQTTEGVTTNVVY